MASTVFWVSGRTGRAGLISDQAIESTPFRLKRFCQRQTRVLDEFTNVILEFRTLFFGCTHRAR